MDIQLLRKIGVVLALADPVVEPADELSDHSASTRLKNPLDRTDETEELRVFGGELLAASRGQCVIPCPTIMVRRQTPP